MSRKYSSRSEPLLRPGITSGHYPERPPSPAGWLHSSIHSIKGATGNIGLPNLRFKRTLKKIKHHGAGFEKLDREALAEITKELRIKLHQQGLTRELTEKSFALIREISGRTISMRHFDTQLMGGWIMIHGGLAEMETGEGKTLTATLAAATAGLAGIPVHIITVNDYLVTRDAELMGPLYKALGLTTGTITAEMDPEQRRAAYACDITYCTNKQLAFDYLRDRILFGNDHGRLRIQLEKMHDNNSRMKRLFLRGLCFAIIDEADSVLIDEARTPLIISREGNNEAEDEIHRQAMNFAKQLKETRDFSIDQLNRIVQLTEKGSKLLSIIIKSVGGIWNGKRRREELVCQALSARNLYIRDHHYLVQDGKIMIIDANTGRTMKDRSWEHGLHQMIEIKEGCEFTAKREHVARLTYQRFFRRYLRLSGMTGTASEVRKELWSIYHLPVIKVPTNKPSQRKRINDEVYCNKSEKWAAVLGHIRRTNQQERPVLIGTRSVSDSEHLSELLNKEGLDHQVLNARQDSGEAEIVAKAGIKGCITVATNMAGRGTDIPLGKGVADIGGLHIISTEQNEARRIDRQLYGRCGRQGDHGSHISILSLEDELLQNHFKKTILRLLNFLITKNRLISQRLCLFSMRFAQSSEEHRHLQMRRTLLRADEQIAKLLAFSGKIE